MREERTMDLEVTVFIPFLKYFIVSVVTVYSHVTGIAQKCTQMFSKETGSSGGC